MTKDEFSLLFHRAQVNLVAFKMLYEPEAFEAMQRMVEMAVSEEREACAKIVDDSQDGITFIGDRHVTVATAIRARGNRV